MNIIYCEPRSALFAFEEKKMPEALPEEEARRRHKRRQAYEAVICEAGHPLYVVSLGANAASTKKNSRSRCKEGNGDRVSVDFIDDKWRSYLYYSFQERQPGKLFMTHARFWEFIGDSDEVLNFKMLKFEENGYIFMVDEDLAKNTVKELEANYSVEENWEEYPRFGDYARLCVAERKKVPVHEGGRGGTP